MRIKARAGVRKAPRTDYLNYDEVKFVFLSNLKKLILLFFHQIGNWLMEQVQKFPNMATLTSIGKTYENRNIWLIKVSSTCRLLSVDWKCNDTLVDGAKRRKKEKSIPGFWYSCSRMDFTIHWTLHDRGSND